MFEGLGSRTYRFRFLIVAAWIAAAALAYFFAPSIASQGTADQASFLPPSAASAVAERALGRAFPGSTATSSATITFFRSTGLTDADRAYLDGFGEWSRSDAAPVALREAVTGFDTARSRPELGSMLASADGQLELLNVNLNVASAGDEASLVVAALREHAAASAPAGLDVHVTGAAGITTDYLEAIKTGTDSTTKVTVILVLVILLLIYRAPLAALVPLVTIGGAFLVARGALGLLAAAGWQISSLLDTFVVVLVFGVGTDYTIFLISRYREEVSAGDWHDASRRTVRRIGAVISASAATVIVGLGAMAFASFEMIRSTGPALAVAIGVTLVAGLTLAPALLGIFGHYLFSPQHLRTGTAGQREGAFARLAALVTRRPGAVTVAIIVALLVPAAFVPQVRTNFDTLAELPAASDARLGFEVVADHLGKGKLVQSTGLIDAGPQGDVLAPASLARLRDVLADISATTGVASVTSLITPTGDGVVPDGFRPSVQLAAIADSFAAGPSDATDSSSSSSSILDPELSSGLSSALDYVNALGLAYPDIAGRTEFRAATTRIEDAQAVVERVRKQSVVSTQLRNIASALLSPASAVGGGDSSDTAIVADYLDELARAYPDVRSLTAYADASSAAAQLQTTPTATAAVHAADALNRLAIHFDATPSATLAAKSLANLPAALEAKRAATAAFDALPIAMRGLAGAYAGRADDIFIPLGLGGADSASLEDAVDAFVSADRTASRFYVTATEDPYASASFAMVRSVQAKLQAAAPRFGEGATASLGGATAQLADVQTVLESDFQRVGIITVVGILVVLALLLRAVVAPVYLVATVLLSYASAVGLAGWLFQSPLGQPGVSFYLPLLVFVLLVALGSDYNIFLMSRVREESEARPIGDGIRIASGRTGAVITSAGLILAGTFGSMATAELAVLFQIGVAVAIGVLIDTFIVRSILVPAITMVAGARAWWPSGWRRGGEGPSRGGHRRAAGLPIALALAILVPATFAGIILWAQSVTSPALAGAIVNGDDGAVTMAGDGATRTLRFGDDLTAILVRNGVAADVAWTATDATTAAAGLGDGTFDAVLTIPAGYSRALVAVRTGDAGAGAHPTLHLQTRDADAAAAHLVAHDVAAAVSVISTRDATASYVADLLLARSSMHDELSAAVPTARDIQSRTTTLAADASGVATVSGELVVGLKALAAGTTLAVNGAAKLADGMGALADGTSRLASGAGTLAAGATDAASGATQLSDGVAQLAGGLRTLQGETSGLPAETTALASGATQLASGAAASAAGAASLAAGLATLQAQTAGLGGAVEALDAAAGTEAAGASDLAGGAADTAAGAGDVAAGAAHLAGAVDAYTSSVDALAAACAGMGGGSAVCDALAGISTSSHDLTAAANGVASGAADLADGASSLADGATDVATGATVVHAGTSQLAESAGALEDAIAAAAAGAATLATGSGQVAVASAQLAAGLDQLAAAMPALTVGVAQLASSSGTLADGAASLADGVSRVASGTATLASGLSATAKGAQTIASGLASSADGASGLAGAVMQIVDGATLEDAEIAQLARDGGLVADRSGDAVTALEAAADRVSSRAGGTPEQAAARAATPIAVDTVTASGVRVDAATTNAPVGMDVVVAAVLAWLLGAGFVALLVALRRHAAGFTVPSWRFPASPRHGTS